MKLFNTLAMAAALVLATQSFAHEFKAGDLEIQHPYARAMLPGAKVGGGYLEIVNEGRTDDRLVGVTSDRAPSVQLHQMSVDNGVMVMREVPDGISIPKGQTTSLKPGSYHLMFMNVPRPFKEGESVKAVLKFQNAGSVEVEFAVGPAAGGKPAMEGGMNHEGHHQ